MLFRSPLPASPSSTPSATPARANSSISDSSVGSGIRSLRPSFSRQFSKPKVAKEKTIPGIEKTIYSAAFPFNRPPYVENMIRERVSITGVVRPLEPASELAALNLDPEDIGLVKEGPVKRYLAGSELRKCLVPNHAEPGFICRGAVGRSLLEIGRAHV